MFSTNGLRPDRRAKRRRIRLPHLLIGTSLLAAVFAPVGGADKPASPDEVLKYLDQTTDWYRRVIALDWPPISSEEVLYRGTVRQNGGRIFELAMEFGRSEAARVAAAEQSSAATTAPAGSARTANLIKAVATTEDRIRQFREQLDALNREISASSATSRPVLDARLQKLQAELRLLNTRRDVLQGLIQATSATEGGTAATLLQKIEDLEGSVPQINEPKPTSQPAAATSTTPPSTFPDSRGVLGLVTEMFSLSRQMSEIKAIADQTESLFNESKRLRAPIRSEIMDLIKRSDATMQAPEADDPAVLRRQGQDFDVIAARIRNLAQGSIPLREQEALLSSSHASLGQWRETLSRAYSEALQALLVRLAAMGFAVLVLLVISNIWRRATFRYVQDVRRRVQFLLVRRIVVGFILVLIVLASFITEFGSLATFAGILTAGVAVALQTFIVSGVAYFFFIGRYGVRVGDRVTVGGITGDVIDVGLFRFYLMELGGTDMDRHPTGRIVFFSNSVLFQPAAFFKQIPGVDYSWQKVAIRLAPETDHHLAEARLMSAVESVYSQYRSEIERQHHAIKKSLHLQFEAPKPEGRLRIAEDGIEFTVRYPVDMQQAVQIEDRITRAVLDTIAKEPKLTLVSPPKVGPVK